MTDKVNEELLQKLFSVSVRILLQRIQSEDCKPMDISNAIKLLKDNGIHAVPEDGPTLDALLDNLPPEEAFPLN